MTERPENEAMMIDDEVAKVRQVVLDLFGPPGTAEADSVAQYVRSLMANYAMAAVMDSAIRNEAMAVCEEELTPIR